MSPILVRPVREQLEHDRVIRLLQQDLAKKKVDVGINPGAEQNASVGGAGRKEFPDAVLYSTEKGRKLIGVVEVETAESVNYLEAMSLWALLAKLRVPFHLYVPTGSADAARRLSDDHRISVTEIWSYHQVGEQFKFTLIYPPARGRSAATAPRMVSVASIRVEPRVDPTALEIQEEAAARPAAQTRSVPQTKSAPPTKSMPAARSASPGPKLASEPPSPRVIPARPRVITAKAAAATPAAKPAVARPVTGKPPVATPGKATPTAATAPAKSAAKTAPSKTAPVKAAPAKAAPAKVAPAKTAPAKVAPGKAVTSASRAPARPPAGRPSAPRKAAPVRKAAARPPAAARGSKTKLASARKPAPKRR